MKKKIMTLAVILSAFLGNNAYAEKIGYTQNENGEVTVTAEGFKENSMVSLTVYSEIISGGEQQKYIKQLDEKKSDNSGNAVFKFNFFETDPSATYVVSVQDETMIGVSQTTEIEFKNALVINLVNKAKDFMELSEVLKKNSVALNLDITMLEETDEETVCRMIFSKKSTYNTDNFDEFRKLYFEVCMIDIIKRTEAGKLEQVLEKYPCGIDVSADSDYNKLSETARLSLCTKVKGMEFNDLSQLCDEWKEQLGLTIIETVKYPALYSWITDNESMNLKENYGEVLGFSENSEYEQLIDKKAPYQAIAGKNFKSKEEAQNAFNAACDTQYNKENQSPSKSGGGSSSGGSGGGMPAVAVNVNSSIQNETEAPEVSGYYSDISDFSWAEKAINSLTDKKVLSGTGNGLFKPEKEVTREEFLKMLVVALDLPVIESKKRFDDVAGDEWYAEFVSTGVEIGIVQGVSDELFGSGCPIMRADMAVMIERATRILGIELKAVTELIDFADSESIPEYAQNSVEKVQMSGIINGYTDRTFKPSKTATRAESAVVIYKLLELK